jgi:hopene-associated glycosyltransferase HpnB
MFTHLPIMVGILVVGIWGYLLFGRGGFWRVKIHQPNTMQGTVRVSALVPARNEAKVIARSVKSLVAQQNVNIRVFVVDDDSSDDTYEIAKSVSSELVVIKGRPLPKGWSGKLWAVQQGIEAANGTAPDFFLLTDADVEHAPGNITRLVAIAQTGNYDLASSMVRLHCESLSEKLLIPAFVFFFFKLYPPQWISDPKASTAGAAGGCILIRPEALSRAGGLERIRGEIIDDCALAREVKRSGGRIWLGLTDSAASIRPYASFPGIGRMISRTAFNQLRHSTALLAVAILGLLLTYIAPVALLFASPIAAAIALAMMTVSYAPMVRIYRLNPLWTLTLPFAALFYGAATLHSAVQYWRGLGGDWKGRAQDRLGARHAN